MILKSEKNKLNCCQYHSKQNYDDICQDKNWVISVVDNITEMAQCKKCRYIRTYVSEFNKSIKTLL